MSAGEDALIGLLQAILILFIILDPIGNAPLFYAYTISLDKAKRREIIVKSVGIAAGLLTFFAFLGEPFLKFFGITLSDFRVAGGSILLIYGVLGILGKTEVEITSGRPEDLAVVPFATPLLAGPGAIATVIYVKYSWGLRVALSCVAVNAFLALFLLLAGERLFRALGRNFSLLLSRLMAMLLAAIAIAMIRQGIEEILG
ncbi:MAG: MarC family protein [Fervidicoccaceae archaeon]